MKSKEEISIDYFPNDYGNFNVEINNNIIVCVSSERTAKFIVNNIKEYGTQCYNQAIKDAIWAIEKVQIRYKGENEIDIFKSSISRIILNLKKP